MENNAADTTPRKRGQKIMRSLDGQTPLRVTEVPFLVRKHKKLDSQALEKAGGLGQCQSCHPGATQGDFDGDLARIPQ